MSSMLSSSVKTIASLVDVVASRAPSSLALVSPFQKHASYSYQQLSQTSHALAAWLNMYEYEKNHVMMSDLPNTSENLILQLACNRLGVHYATSKNLEAMSKFPRVQGAVSATCSGFLADTNLPFPYLGGDFLMDLIHGGGLDDFAEETVDIDGQEEEVEEEDPYFSRIHAFYNSTTGYTNQQALTHGQDAAQQLNMNDRDVVCISVTLCHAFGMGSAVCSALSTGATIVLPAVGGIQGCGVPSERAAATLNVLQSEKCTLLFADTHTLKALSELDPLSSSSSASLLSLENLRGGACKVGSGDTFLEETVEYAGVKLRTVGNKPTLTST